MTIIEYQKLAMRTNDGMCDNRLHEKENIGELINGALGLTGEAGEVSDIIKKHVFHGHDLDKDEIIKELGDVCWYVALLSHAIGVPLEDILQTNVDKLKRRYPEGFSETNSINRVE